MSLEEILTAAGVDYETVLDRFCGKEKMLARYFRRLPEDVNFTALRKQLAEGDYASAEYSAHSLKGLSGILGYTGLHVITTRIVNDIREGKTQDLPEFAARIEEEYARACQTAQQVAEWEKIQP